MKRILLILFILLTVPVCSQESAPFIVNNDNITNFNTAIKEAGKVNFIVFQADFDKSDKKVISSLMEWVERGGCLWFYDSRLAPFFGMKNSPMNIKNLESQSMSAEFGSGKLSGVPLGALAESGDSVNIGVRRVVVFVPAVGHDLYSAVENQEDLTPLLQVPQQKNSLVAAIKKQGKGSIVFKPLLWTKQYDGAVFQRRIINYSQKGEPLEVLSK